jgi:SAM-dependent methyltransferase
MKPAAFLREHARPVGSFLQLSEETLEEVARQKLPFTSRNYYAFCDKYLDEDANEALFLDEDEKIFREIATDYDIFRYFSFLRRFFKTAPVFCDLGCGIGNVLHYTRKLGYSSYGYEINGALRTVHARHKMQVLYEDVLKADLGRFGETDVLYLYRPINDTRLMNKLLALIHRHTAEDVIICYNYPHSRTIKGYTTLALGPYEDMIILLKNR